TPFIGRRDELAALTQLLSTVRLLSLTGPGGCGKTRLALQVCRDAALQQLFADGVLWCDLAPLSDPANVPQRIAAELGLYVQPDRSITATIAEALVSMHLLIVLDNCEHVLSACATLVDVILREGAEAKV